MTKSVLIFLFSFFVQMAFSQNNVLWKGYFSYNEIKDISQSSNTLFAASENSLFSKNFNTENIKTTNTVDGLSGKTISTVHYSVSTNKSIIGYEHGLIIVINEADGKMINVVDIINKQLPAELKRINHFMEHDGLVYISCGFGIVQFNLKTMLFGDTYFIGDNGAEIGVSQTAVFNGFIFASTKDGIRKADLSNKNLIDFKQWKKIANGNWTGIETFGTQLLAVNSAANIQNYNNSSDTFLAFYQLPQEALDFRSVNEYLIATTVGNVYVFNNQMVLKKQISNSQIAPEMVNFSCATVVNNKLCIGTKENGIYNTTIENSTELENIKPDGPVRNSIFAMQTTSTSLWAVYGDYNLFYDPYGLDSYGISKFSDKGWLNIPYEKVLNAKSLVRIAVNPTNENEVYVSSYFSGLLKIVDDVPQTLFNQVNSGLESLVLSGSPDYIDVRINGTAFDKAGNLWLTNSLLSKNGLKKLSPSGQWQSFALDKIINAPSLVSFGRLSIDKNDTKWFVTDKEGLIGFNEKNNTLKKIAFGPEVGNLPNSDVRVAAVDNNNQLWIGTASGLRILSNTSDFLTEEKLTTKPIIILEDDLAQELMYEQFITDIVVDGANNKWIATNGSGVFLVSPNGQETKYHFTENNSPLPSNVINDIDINAITGEVFIATNRGMVSFKSVATAPKDDLNNVIVYPNPVRPNYSGTVKISNLLNKATIKITDIEGNLVHETTSEGGTVEWDTTAFGKHKVASGVYIIFISAQDGVETKVKKVMIIR